MSIILTSREEYGHIATLYIRQLSIKLWVNTVCNTFKNIHCDDVQRYLRNILCYDNVIGFSRYDIIVCLDKGLIFPLYVQIYSMYKNLRKPIFLWVLQSDFGNADKERLDEFCTTLDIHIYILDVNVHDFSQFDTLFKSSRYKLQCLYYFISHLVLPSYVKRALYLDIDTLILNDLEDFYSIDFDGTWLVASLENYKVTIRENIDILYGKREFTYRFSFSNEILYNTGVILLNLEKFRRSNITLNDFSVQEYDVLVDLPDGLLLNRFTRLNVKLVNPSRYNYILGFTQYYNNPKYYSELFLYNKEPTAEKPSIIHFTMCKLKPQFSLLCINNAVVHHPIIRREFLYYFNLWWEYAFNIPKDIFLVFYLRHRIVNGREILKHFKK